MSRNTIRFGRPKAKRPSIPKTPVELHINSLSLEGRGVAKHDGMTVFVEGALPNETVLAKINKMHKRYMEALVDQVLVPSPERQDAKCRYFGQCGGCELQHFKQEAQILAKQGSVLELLKRMSDVIPEKLESPITSPAYQYRRTARVGLNQLSRDGSVIVGFRRKHSNKLIPIADCPVLETKSNSLLPDLTELLESISKPKNMTHAEMQEGESGVNLSLRCKGTLSASDLSLLTHFAVSKGINLNLISDNGINTLVDQHENFYELKDQSLRINFEPGDFLQVNSLVNQQMVTQAMNWLSIQPSDTVLDLFSGLGNFTLPAARFADTVTGVEGSKEMVNRATQNAQHNQIDNTDFYCADLSSDLSNYHWFKGKYTKIILDPPRTGASDLLKSLKTKAERILYISCEPSALARDSKILKEKGYKLTRFCVMDMFPNTSHIESMALFEPAKK